MPVRSTVMVAANGAEIEAAAGELAGRRLTAAADAVHDAVGRQAGAGGGQVGGMGGRVDAQTCQGVTRTDGDGGGNLVGGPVDH